MIDEDTIKAKLNIIRENLLKIKDLLKLSDAELKASDVSRSALERYFQLMVDAAVGVNEHIISEENLESPSDYFNTFPILGRAGILPLEFAERIAPSVGLRNQLIHQYEKIDVDRMLRDIRKDVTDYDDYIAYIVKHYNLVNN